MSTYFLERCAGGSKSSDFWKTNQPYMSNTSISKNNKIILNENENLVTVTENVTEMFNDFFVHVVQTNYLNLNQFQKVTSRNLLIK